MPSPPRSLAGSMRRSGASSDSRRLANRPCAADPAHSLARLSMNDSRADGSSLRARLTEIRRAAGLTQEALARLLGRGQSVISRWESGDRALTPGDLVDLAYALVADLDDLLRWPVGRDRRFRASRARASDERKRTGRVISDQRVQTRLDPVLVATSAGISPYRLWRIERGAEITIWELVHLSEALALAPADLLRLAGLARDLSLPSRRAQASAPCRPLTHRARLDS